MTPGVPGAPEPRMYPRSGYFLVGPISSFVHASKVFYIYQPWSGVTKNNFQITSIALPQRAVVKVWKIQTFGAKPQQFLFLKKTRQ